MTHHYQRVLCPQYLLLMQVQARQKYLHSLIQIMISYSQTSINQLNITKQISRSHLQRETQCMFSPISLPLFSHRSYVWLTEDKKGLCKACNEVELIGSMTSSHEMGPCKDLSFSSFFQFFFNCFCEIFLFNSFKLLRLNHKLKGL